MGHVNIIANSIGEVRKRVFEVMNIIYGEEAEKNTKITMAQARHVK